jgi:hypothetical protein
VVAGILASVVDDGVALLRSRDRSFSHALAERPTDDPLYQKQLGWTSRSWRPASAR